MPEQSGIVMEDVQVEEAADVKREEVFADDDEEEGGALEIRPAANDNEASKCK